MKASTINLVSWTISLAVTAGLGFYVYKSQASLKLPTRYADKSDTVGRDLAEKALRSAQTDTVVDGWDIGYDKDVVPNFVEHNWSGKIDIVVPEDEGPVEAPPPKRVEIKELMTVIYFQVDTSDAGGSRVLVKYIGDLASFETAELRVADTLPPPHDGIAVVAITTDSVEFSFTEEGRDNEVFNPSFLDSSVIFVVPADSEALVQKWESLIGPASEVPDTRPLNTIKVAPGVYQIGREDSSHLTENYQSILSKDVRTRTRIGPNGERAGIEIMEVAQGSFAQRHGVSSGDVVISINNHPVNSQQEAIQWAKDNGEGVSVFEVVVERLGRLQTLTYRNPDAQ